MILHDSPKESELLMIGVRSWADSRRVNCSCQPELSHRIPEKKFECGMCGVLCGARRVVEKHGGKGDSYQQWSTNTKANPYP